MPDRTPRHDDAGSRHAHRLLWIIILSMMCGCASRSGRPPVETSGINPARKVPQSAAGEATPQATAAAFDGCDTCHVDVADELAGTRHLAKRVSCVRCHGRSIEHVRDENNEVKPDRVFTRGDIDAFCVTCHKCSRPQGSRQTARGGSPRSICTDCHGSHRIRRSG